MEEKKKGSTVKSTLKKTTAGFCPYEKECGGCTKDYSDLPYEAQLKKKEELVRKLIGHLTVVKPSTGMEAPLHYRNKVHAVFSRKKGRIVSGIYQEGTHKVVDVEGCLIEDQISSAIIRDIRDLAESFKIRIVDEDTGQGLLRHVLVRRAFATGEVMVVLVTSSFSFPSVNNFIKALRTLHPEITTIVLNLNRKKTSMVLGDQEKVLYGKGYITDFLCGKKFRLSSKSFYQVNPIQTERLYGKGIELAGLTGEETVLDAYCGIGTIGLTASDRCKSLIGVELNPDAVKDAIFNSRENGVTNARFYAEDAGEFLERISRQEQTPEVIFMDPPRSGSSRKFLDSLVRTAPKKVVYISCNPETLARDLDYLSHQGFRVLEAWPFDMFPYTGHVEVVSLLQRLSNTRPKAITLDVDMEDY